MKSFCLFCLLLLNKGFGQSVFRTVLDRASNQPVSYATLKVLHKPSGTMTTAKGEFELSFEPSDSILITSIGYQEMILIGRDVGLKIYLSPLPKSLDTVVVRGTTPLRTIILGNGKDFVNKKLNCGKDCEPWGDCIPWGPSDKKEEFAEKIMIDSTKVYRLQKLYIPTRKKDRYGAILLRIYATDEITNLPGEELLFKYIEVNARMIYKNKVVIDISSDDLYISHSSSFFVSMAWPPGQGGRGIHFTSLCLFFMNQDNFYRRSLASKTYDWYTPLYRMNPNENLKILNSAYAVQMEERVYK